MVIYDLYIYCAGKLPFRKALIKEMQPYAGRDRGLERLHYLSVCSILRDRNGKFLVKDSHYTIEGLSSLYKMIHNYCSINIKIFYET